MDFLGSRIFFRTKNHKKQLTTANPSGQQKLLEFRLYGKRVSVWCECGVLCDVCDNLLRLAVILADPLYLYLMQSTVSTDPTDKVGNGGEQH